MISLNDQTIFKNRKSIKELEYQINLIYKYYNSTIKNDIELIDACENELVIRSSKINEIFFEASRTPSPNLNTALFEQRDLKSLGDYWNSKKTDLRTINSIKNHYLSIIGIYINVSIVTLIINTTLYPVRFILGLPSKSLKFLLNSIFGLEFSEQNKTWKLISAFINFTTWFATILPLLEILKKLLHF